MNPPPVSNGHAHYRGRVSPLSCKLKAFSALGKKGVLICQKRTTHNNRKWSFFYPGSAQSSPAPGKESWLLPEPSDTRKKKVKAKNGVGGIVRLKEITLSLFSCVPVLPSSPYGCRKANARALVERPERCSVYSQTRSCNFCEMNIQRLTVKRQSQPQFSESQSDKHAEVCTSCRCVDRASKCQLLRRALSGFWQR